MQIGLLSNPQSGGKKDWIAPMLRGLAGHPEVVHVTTPCREAVPSALWELASRGVEVLAVNGGDWTLQTVLTEILGCDAFDGHAPIVAPLRGGRTNMTALDLGAHRNPVAGIEGLIRAAQTGQLEGRVEERRVLRVEHRLLGRVDYGMFFGGGSIYRGIDLVHRVFPSGRAQGVFGGTLVTGAMLGRLAMGSESGGVLVPDKARISLDGRMLDQDRFTLVMATTLNRLFARMRPFWGSESGRVRVTAMAEGAEDLWKTLPGILRGRPGRAVSEPSGYASRNVDVADLMFDCGYTVDGEPIEGCSGAELRVTASDSLRFARA